MSLLRHLSLFLLAAISSHAIIRSVIPVRVLLSDAAHVVAGTFRATRSGISEIELDLEIDRVFKGSLTAGRRITVIWQKQLAQDAARSNSVFRALLFLRSDAQGRFMIMPAVGGRWIRFEEALLTSQSFPAAPLPGVQPGDDGEIQLYRELLASAGLGNKRALGGFISALRHPIQLTPAKNELVTQTLASPNDDVRHAGIRVLISHGDIRGLRATSDQEDHWFRNSRGPQLSTAIATSFRNPDPTAIEALAQVMRNTKYRELRVGCAAALAWIHTPPALPHLAALLDSSDNTLATYAVGGLAMYANNTPVGSSTPSPGSAPYRTEQTMRMSTMGEDAITRNRSFYIDFWRDWYQRYTATQPGR